MDDDVVFEGPEAVRRWLHEEMALTVLKVAMAVGAILMIVALATGCTLNASVPEETGTTSREFVHIDVDDGRLQAEEALAALDTLNDGVFDASKFDLELAALERVGDEACALATASYSWAGFDQAMDTFSGGDLDTKALAYGMAMYMCRERIESLDGHPATTTR